MTVIEAILVKIAVAVLIAVVFAAGGFVGGVKHERAAEAVRENAALLKATKENQDIQAKANAAAADAAAARAQTAIDKENFDEQLRIAQQVPLHCTVDNGRVKALNALLR